MKTMMETWYPHHQKYEKMGMKIQVVLIPHDYHWGREMMLMKAMD